jgi:hypothetical protein
MSYTSIRVEVKGLDVTDLVERASWRGETNEPHRTLALSLVNTTDNRTRAFKATPGDVVRFYVNDVRVFQGVLFAYDVSEKGAESWTCYDRNYYLLKSVDSRSFKNMKASAIIRTLAKDFGIPVGTIEDTGFVISKLILRNNTLHDMMMKPIILTKKQTKKRFFLGSKDDKLTLRQHKNNVSPWIIETNSNLTGANYSLSIEETKTQVKVTGGKNNKLSHTTKNEANRKRYGVMQHYEEMDEKSTASQVKQRAETLLKELSVIHDQASINAIGIIDVITGCGVYVRDAMTGLAGGYFVSSDSHEFSNGQHDMSLEISKSLEMPDIEISDTELGRDK